MISNASIGTRFSFLSTIGSFFHLSFSPFHCYSFSMQYNIATHQNTSFLFVLIFCHYLCSIYPELYFSCWTAFPNELFYLYSELFFSDSDSNIGLIVGASVGGVIFLIIVIVLIVFYIKKSKRKCTQHLQQFTLSKFTVITSVLLCWEIVDNH